MTAPPASGSPRALALAAGRATFVGGKRCWQGHEPLRYAQNGTCVACHRHIARGFRKRTIEREARTAPAE